MEITGLKEPAVVSEWAIASWKITEVTGQEVNVCSYELFSFPYKPQLYLWCRFGFTFSVFIKKLLNWKDSQSALEYIRFRFGGWLSRYLYFIIHCANALNNNNMAIRSSLFSSPNFWHVRNSVIIGSFWYLIVLALTLISLCGFFFS